MIIFLRRHLSGKSSNSHPLDHFPLWAVTLPLLHHTYQNTGETGDFHFHTVANAMTNSIFMYHKSTNILNIKTSLHIAHLISYTPPMLKQITELKVKKLKCYLVFLFIHKRPEYFVAFIKAMEKQTKIPTFIIYEPLTRYQALYWSSVPSWAKYCDYFCFTDENTKNRSYYNRALLSQKNTKILINAIHNDKAISGI
jgi:hypothetical protein